MPSRFPLRLPQTSKFGSAQVANSNNPKLPNLGGGTCGSFEDQCDHPRLCSTAQEGHHEYSAPKVPLEELLHRDDPFVQALMSHLLQINDDAARVLGAATVRNLASYGEHSGSQFLLLDQATQQSSACSIHHPFTPTTGSPSTQTLHEEISCVYAR